jgi:hypothetical protein
MGNWKNIAIASGTVVVLAGGWALFRPELLFVNQQVSEKAPSSTSQSTIELAKGSFKSYAHESKGTALVLKSNGKSILRLQDFKTSNGPDVHVYLVKGADASQDGVNKNGFVDLGTLKGNIGDQNYDLPTDFDLKNYSGVSIWCKRFGVDFAGATLQASSSTSPTALEEAPSPYAQLASYNFGAAPTITVTHGGLSGKATGTAALIEKDNQRFISLSGLHLPKGSFEVLLVKAEDATTTDEIKAAPQIKLGKATKGLVAFPIDDKVDAWLYRTVSIWDTKTHQSIAVAHLRSDQELKKTFFLI